VGGQRNTLAVLALKRVLIPIVQEAEWALRFDLDGCRTSELHPVLNLDPSSL
jgi:hypothetical protein